MKFIDGRAGTPSASKSETFTGEVQMDAVLPTQDEVTINTVFFPLGSRTFWHEHERGQILQIISGAGRIGGANGIVRTVRAGDTVWCPPGERHWHGAGSDSWMTHTAISLGTTTWYEEVQDDECNR